MSNAARRTDPTVHLGTIAQGAPHTFIAGLAAARKGDPHVCPAHVGGVIIQGSATVFIEGAEASRKHDLCGCAATGTPGAGVPAVLGPQGAPPKQSSSDGTMDADTDGKQAGRGPHAEAELQDTDKDGSYDTARTEASVARMRNQGYKDVGPVELGAKHNMDVVYGRGQAGSSAGYGWGGNASAEVGAVKQGGELSIGPAGDQGRNPYAAVGAEYDKWHAEAKGDVLLGDDGRRVGLGAMGKAGAEVIGGNVSARQSIPIPFTNWTIQTRGKATGAAGSVGVGLGAWAFWDKAEGRFHLGALGELKALVGIELDVDISIGRAYAPDPPPAAPPAPPGGGTPGTGSGGVPNAIAEGCPTVFIGG
ncbi:PAAR domain-containing protein [Nannocystis sp. SCPEA4]|uniref:PAAR domain-containing protein n=1 Tax=Nannocystis sp. SCPEA4 TaxID=2996787 RepID=UPI0022712DC1|nr:PAAR domain-containing protein [Nannocystis sp. SCPEA4]MCY1061620.1 PAAR domain-containing protein [Nannocystis sp. SCPEA4]